MTKINLNDLLNLERIDELTYRGTTPGIHWGRVFGGQVVAQALAAAYNTVEERICHSLHAYFLRPGNPEKPIILHVDIARDGGSFSSRRVTAVQDGKQILNLAASFKVPEEGIEHYRPMPDVPMPEELPSYREVRSKFLHMVPKDEHEMFLGILPVDSHPVNPINWDNPQPDNESFKLWFRLKVDKKPDNQRLHQILMSYISDMELMHSSGRKHGFSPFKHNVQGASLDHAVWFHQDFDATDWFLYEMISPAASDATGLCFGSIFSRDGRHVCTVAQQGLIRLKELPQNS